MILTKLYCGYLNYVLHTFCFACILQWADVVSSCPMCKMPFKSIIHNVRGVDSYDQVIIITDTQSFD